METIRECIEDGRYLDTRHAVQRQAERNVTRPEYIHALLNGYHEKRKDKFEEAYNAWNYSVRGKTIDDVAKVEEIKIAGQKATYLDVSGTFTAPSSKKEPQADYRMLAVYFDGKDNLYTFKLVGPAATVEAAKKGFDDWLKAYK